jgi:Type ISP C-terminal specificity domain/N-6 DNA Methylase
VWFTPPDVVRYMVARIDKVLREQLQVANGFADPNVFVLDPCCGTGAFLVEVLRQIETTLKANGGDALTAEDIKTAAMERVFGFELLPAPFVVSHLQLGLFLQNLGAPLSEKLHERVGVYLTNALTGWNPPKGPKQKLMFPEMEEERDAAELVKRDRTILVVLGNPPYYAFAGVSPEEEQGLVEPYKEGLASEWKIRKYNLDELYVRFLRLAERRIAEMSKRGIVCYISSYSYLSDPSFVVVRKRLCEEFNYAWLDCLNGDSRETGKLTPDGQPDPSVFSTEYNREGIRLGTSVGLFAKTGGKEPVTVRYREFWGTDKRVALLKTLENNDTFDAQYEQVEPVAANRFSFRPSNTEVSYASWPTVVELAEEEPISGLQEMRRGALMAYDKDTLRDRMRAYFEPDVNWATFAALGRGLSKDAGRFNPATTRARLQEAEAFDEARLRRYSLYPLDVRWCYYSSVRPLWNEPRPELVSQRADDESSLIVRRFAERPKEGRPAFFTSALPDYHLLRPNVTAIPLRLRTSPVEGVSSDARQSTMYEHLATHNGTTANLSEGARQYLTALTSASPDEDEALSRSIWHHALAILYTPLYLLEHVSAVRANWPRIPLPATLAALQHSAELGITVGQLLDMDRAALGVTAGKLRKELNFLGRVSGPQKGLSLAITAGWGHGQKEKDIVMPGRGIEKRREFTADEKNAIAEGAKELGLGAEEVTALWGSHTLDIYLNNETFWSNVPEAVWEYAIGGYQVLKKWLSYRERQVLGRDISKDEAREFTHIVRRIAALGCWSRIWTRITLP